MDRHPDVLRVSPSGHLIKIDHVRDLCRSLAMKPYEARMRVAIIGEAHRMNPPAANALLKMLEEPPAGTVLILTAPQTADLPPTIVSRCQMVRFKPISRNHLAGMLVAAHGFAPQEAALTAALANGSVTRALAMQRRHWIRRRNWILSELAELPHQPAVLLLALAEKTSQAKEDIPAILDVLDAWVRDVAVARHCPERIIHHDLRNQIRSAAHRTDVPCLIQAARALAEARRRLQANANPRLTLEALLIKMAPAFQAATSA
jgi:DNA polymerase-3 subunit delta'